MQMVQRLLFGVRRPELRYTDVLRAELASLLIVVLVLLALGLAPTTLFASEGTLLGPSPWETHPRGIARSRDRHRSETDGVARRGSSLAGEVIAQYWPMRTFVHHNPLHSLEYLPFEETVRRGKQFMGGSGYLPSACIIAYLRSGRIRPEHLDQV